MPLSGKERAKRFRERIKADPEKHVIYLQNEKQRWKDRTEKGKVKRIGDLSARSQAKKRRDWRKASNARNNLLRENRKLEGYLKLNSPPHSSDDNNIENADLRQNRGRGRRRIHHLNRSRTVRKLNKTQDQLLNQERLVEKYKKRLNRLKARERDNVEIDNSDTPRTKTNKLIRQLENSKHRNKARRTLLFHHALVEELKQKQLKNKGTRNLKVISGQILAKYRLLDEARKQIKLSRRRSNFKGNANKSGNPGIPRRYVERIKEFYERDDVSRMKPGKKDTVTKRKDKKQIRLLTDTLTNLFNKFQSENPYIKICLASFCNLRPFWVRPPNLKDRNTCLCKRHDNAQFLLDKLVTLKIVSSTTVDSFTRAVVCTDSLECMTGLCERCKSKKVIVDDQGVLENEVTWYKWNNSKKTITLKAGEEKEIKVTIKELMKGKVKDLIEELENMIPDLCQHVYTTTHQFKQSKSLKEHCSSNPNSAIIHIDFSENWESKYGHEIQSVHFGGSHVQVTLHTGVMYISDQCIPFCTISDATRHDPAAIWAYLGPVLSYLSLHFPLVQNLHFQSDGPSTQYKNKTNFFFLSTIPFDRKFNSVSWDYWESGHGKGAPDGIGAVIKRTADSLVSQGTDIPNADTLFEALVRKQIQVKLFFVPIDEIKRYDDIIPQSLKPVKGTMKIRQILCEERHTLTIRNFSCYCSGLMNVCSCYQPKSVAVYSDDNMITEPISMAAISTIEAVETSSNTTILTPPAPDALPEELMNQWCVVDYDGKPYLGRIVEADSDGVEVSTLQPIGKNKFVWPTLEDKIWYEYIKVVTLIDAPERLSSRRELYQISKSVWAELEKVF